MQREMAVQIRAWLAVFLTLAKPRSHIDFNGKALGYPSSRRLWAWIAVVCLIIFPPFTLASEPLRPTAASATLLRGSEKVVGPLPGATPMHIAVALKIHNRVALDEFIASASGKAMPQERLRADHLPTQSQAQAVFNFLQHAGFKNILIADNRLLVMADGTAALAEAAFGASLQQVLTADGRSAYANSRDVAIPKGFDDTILSIIGLQTVHRPHTMIAKPSAYALPGDSQPSALQAHNPLEFASIYGANGEPTAAGVQIGIITAGSLANVLNDLSTFAQNNQLGPVATQIVQSGAASTDTSNDNEWDLDSQDILGMSGGAVGKIIFYNTTSLNYASLVGSFNAAVSSNVAKIINVSLGGCETDALNAGIVATLDQTFALAVAQGQTFSVSTGDKGADECGDGGTTPSWPAASQYVIAVAGTTLDATTTTWNSETVWNNGIGNATGGSESKFETKPSWQTSWAGPRRGVADVAFDGNPNTGAVIIVDGHSAKWGGTSLSAPLFSGMWARMIASKGTTIGFAGPMIYQLAPYAFHDISSGNNNGETAGVGYDLCSGRGSMIMRSAVIGHHPGRAATVLRILSINSDLIFQNSFE